MSRLLARVSASEVQFVEFIRDIVRDKTGSSRELGERAVRQSVGCSPHRQRRRGSLLRTGTCTMSKSRGGINRFGGFHALDTLKVIGHRTCISRTVILGAGSLRGGGQVG